MKKGNLLPFICLNSELNLHTLFLCEKNFYVYGYAKLLFHICIVIWDYGIYYVKVKKWISMVLGTLYLQKHSQGPWINEGWKSLEWNKHMESHLCESYWLIVKTHGQYWIWFVCVNLLLPGISLTKSTSYYHLLTQVTVNSKWTANQSMMQ